LDRNACSHADLTDLSASLDSQGYALVPDVLSRAECESLAGLYADDALFRSRIDMAMRNEVDARKGRKAEGQQGRKR